MKNPVTLLGQLFRRLLQRGRVDEMVEEEGLDPELIMHWRPFGYAGSVCGVVLELGVKWTVEGAFATCPDCSNRWRGGDLKRFTNLR
jgi:hypothetical protein